MSEEREQLEALWSEINPEPRKYTAACRDPASTDDYLRALVLQRDKWRASDRTFRAMLDAEAYLSAAEMLVPEGWTWAYLDGAAIVRKTGSWEHGYGGGTTPALALISAIRAARDAP